MPLYRAYVLDEHGHVVGAIDLECVDDGEARESAKRLGDGDVELWRQVPLSESERGRREREPR